MHCPQCRTENAPQAKFCAQCGAQLILSCPSCGEAASPGQKFCAHCGKPLLGDPSSSRLASLASYTPKHLTEKIFTSRAGMEGERKQVTVVFCDIVDSTALAERIGAEAMHDILNHFFEVALGEVHRYEGTLNQFLGDGFMALFGAPIAHEDHARRAACAALGIRRAVQEKRADTGAAADGLALRLGMNTGPVVVGKIGDNLRMDYTAVGDTTNLAARMQQMAAPGEILLSEHTREAIRPHFECEALGERRVKGKAQYVPVYRLGEARASRSGPDTRELALRTAPLVGRERELGMLRDCIARLRAGSGGMAGVIGEPGLGKSRLLLELRRWYGADLWWLEGRALSFGQTLSYGPFVDALRGIAGIEEREGRDANWRKVELFLRERLDDAAAEVLPFAGMLMGLELPAMASALVARLDPQDVRGQIFIAARRIFEALARSRPVVLELEDWQWADEASAALTQHLLPLTESHALLVCFAGRPDAGTPCTRLRDIAAQRYPQRYVEMLLAPLSSSDSNRLVENLVGVEHMPPQLRGLILRKAEGNPLFIEEVLRSLQASGTLHRDPVTGDVRVIGDVEAIELPDTIEALIMARIDRLEAEVKQVLRLAAVIGRSFHRRILQALDEAEHQLDACLDQLQQFELIRQRRLAPEVEYMFKHALVHEASYRSILAERRRELHKRVAEAVEILFSDRLDEFASLLAYHFARGAQWDKAQRYLLRAGDQAARIAADSEATAHYREAMQTYARAFGDRWEPLQRASLERKLGEAEFRLGQHEQASGHLHAALRLLGDRYPRTRWGVRLHIFGHALQQLWHQLRARRYGLAVDQPGAADTERVRAYVSLGWLDFWRDEERFLLDCLAGLNWAERSGIRTAVAQGWMGLAVACDVLRLPRWSAHYHRRALQLAEQLQDPVCSASAEYGMAVHQMLAGDWDQAAAGLAGATEVFKSQGKLRERGIAAATLTWLLEFRGEFARAQSILTELGHVAEDADDAQSTLYVISQSALFQMHRGQLLEAAAAMDRGIEGLEAIPDYQIACQTYGKRACCALWAGELQQCAAVIEEARRLMREHRIASHLTASVPTTNGWLALTLLEQADPRHASTALKRARSAIRALHRLDTAFAGVVPIALCLEGCVEWLCGQRRVAAGAWDRSLSVANKIGARYYAAVAHQQMGRLMREPPHLREALSLFEEFGATFEAARTHRYLGELLAREDEEAAVESFARALHLHASMSAEYERSVTHSAYSDLLVKMGRNSETVELR